MNLAAKTAAALLEFERLGRLSNTTRDDLTEALDDVAAGRVVEVDDDQGDDESPDEPKTAGAKASGTSKGAPK